MEDADEEMVLVAGAVANASLADQSSSDDDDESEEEDVMEGLPPVVAERVHLLQSLNQQRDTLVVDYIKERAALEQKYAALYEPLYKERTKVVVGEAAADDNTMANDESPAMGIPQFWLCALGHHETVADYLTEEDVDCLEHLMDIKSIDDADGAGFVLEFHFNSQENPYFSRSILTKRYSVPNLYSADEPILKNVVGCDIDWTSDDKCLTFRTVIRKQRGKGAANAGQVRTVKKKTRRDSFFHFFSPPVMPNMDDMDQEEADRLEEAFDADYDVALSIRNQVIPRAVAWFTNSALAEELQEHMGEMLSDNNNDNSNNNA